MDHAAEFAAARDVSSVLSLLAMTLIFLQLSEKVLHKYSKINGNIL